MEILLANTIWTGTLNVTANTFTVSGNNNVPLDTNSLVSIYNTTHAGYFNMANLQFQWNRSNSLPIYTWLFSALPASSANNDTLNVLFAIPQNQADFLNDQKEDSAPVGTPGTLVTGEVPSGSINGTNKVFTLANTPISGSVVLQSAGVLQYSYLASSNQAPQYSISGNTITFVTAPASGGSLYCNYYH